MTKQAIGSGILALQLIKTYNSDRAGLATRFPGMSKGVRIARGESFQFWTGGTNARLPQEWPKQVFLGAFKNDPAPRQEELLHLSGQILIVKSDVLQTIFDGSLY